MQWTTHNPPWYRWFMVPFGKPLFPQHMEDSIEEAFVEHARRSIDHIQDPASEHCPHNVKVAGEGAAKCAICSFSKPQVPPDINNLQPA